MDSKSDDALFKIKHVFPIDPWEFPYKNKPILFWWFCIEILNSTLPLYLRSMK